MSTALSRLRRQVDAQIAKARRRENAAQDALYDARARHDSDGAELARQQWLAALAERGTLATDPRGTTPFGATWQATLALLRGRVLHCAGLTAGKGALVDWRTVRSGEALLGGDGKRGEPEAVLALALVREVGPGAVLDAVEEGGEA